MIYFAVSCAVLAGVLALLQLINLFCRSNPEDEKPPLCHHCDKSLRLVQAREIKAAYDYARNEKYFETTPQGATHYCNCKEVTKYFIYKETQEEV